MKWWRPMMLTIHLLSLSDFHGTRFTTRMKFPLNSDLLYYLSPGNCGIVCYFRASPFFPLMCATSLDLFFFLFSCRPPSTRWPCRRCPWWSRGIRRPCSSLGRRSCWFCPGAGSWRCRRQCWYARCDRWFPGWGGCCGPGAPLASPCPLASADGDSLGRVWNKE